MSRLVVGWIALFSAACSSELARPDPAGGQPARRPAMDTAGSRLKVRTIKGDDGSSAQVGFYDSQLKTPCTFLTAADGVRRCLPEAQASSGYYADDQCTMPLAEGCFGPGDLVKFYPSYCNAGPSVFPIGTTYQGSLYELGGGSDDDPKQCTEVAVTTDPGFAEVPYHLLGDALPPSGFVAEQGAK